MAGRGTARRHDRRLASPARPARASGRSCRAASRCGSRATPTTTSARGCRAAASSCARRASAPFVAEEQRHRRQRHRLRRDRRRDLPARHRRRALLRAQLGCHRGRRGRRRPRLRVHDRWSGRRARRDRAATSAPACRAASPTCTTADGNFDRKVNYEMVEVEHLDEERPPVPPLDHRAPPRATPTRRSPSGCSASWSVEVEPVPQGDADRLQAGARRDARLAGRRPRASRRPSTRSWRPPVPDVHVGVRHDRGRCARVGTRQCDVHVVSDTDVHRRWRCADG